MECHKAGIPKPGHRYKKVLSLKAGRPKEGPLNRIQNLAWFRWEQLVLEVHWFQALQWFQMLRPALWNVALSTRQAYGVTVSYNMEDSLLFDGLARAQSSILRCPLGRAAQSKSGLNIKNWSEHRGLEAGDQHPIDSWLNRDTSPLIPVLTMVRWLHFCLNDRKCC